MLDPFQPAIEAAKAVANGEEWQAEAWFAAADSLAAWLDANA